jgi:folate-dependent phosphoribosylglycinamide formyltransferase PurN
LLNIAWFSTGRDKAARDLLRVIQNNIKRGEIKAEISFVFCNRRPAWDMETTRFFELATTTYRLPVLYYDWHDFYKVYWRERAPIALTTSRQISLLPSLEASAQAPRPRLVESLHRRLLHQRQDLRGKTSPLRQSPLLPDYQMLLSATEAPQMRHNAFEEWRLAYDREVMKAIKEMMDPPPDLFVLAGYMLIIGAEMCHQYNMINLHPADPHGPTGSWQEVIWKLIDSQAEQTGVMMHLVTPDLDKGPPVAYCTFPIRGKPFDTYWKEIKGQPTEEIKKKQGENNRLFKLIRQHELAREFPLIIMTLQALSRGEISIKDKRVIDAQGKSISGYNLSDRVDEEVKKNQKCT